MQTYWLWHRDAQPVLIPDPLRRAPRPARAGELYRWAAQEEPAAGLVLEANRTLTAEAIGNKSVIREPLVLVAE